MERRPRLAWHAADSSCHDGAARHPEDGAVNPSALDWVTVKVTGAGEVRDDEAV
jgi:hypothetical protein